MKPIPKAVVASYDALIGQKQIPRAALPDYRKWLRYYLDFCHKYNYDPSQKASIPAFLKKLNEKKQSLQQQKQAQHAISLFQELTSIQIQTRA